MQALVIIGACAAALPGVARAMWDLRWMRALQHHRNTADAVPDVPGNPGCTLILCSHNDLESLQSIWPDWRGQKFPVHWEVEWLVVDDGSMDGTVAWLEGQAASDERLTLIRHSKKRPGKKEALASGIEAARYDRLVLTDADCRPAPEWAHAMARSLGPRDSVAAPEVVLGTSLPDGGPALLRFDALRVAFQYAGEAAAGRPYMGVGRNIAYRRSAWRQVGGFDRHLQIASGDDDLFVQDAVAHGLAVALAPAPAPEESNSTLAARGIGDGWMRKRRHLGTAAMYGLRDRLKLTADAAIDPLVVVGAVMGASGLLHKGGWIPVAAMMLAFLVRAITLSSFSRVWGNDGLYPFGMAFWGPIRWIFIASATLVNAFTSSPKWTQRAPTSRS